MAGHWGSPYLRKQEASEVSRDLRRACSQRERERREEEDDDDDGDDAYPVAVGRPTPLVRPPVARCMPWGGIIQIARPTRGLEIKSSCIEIPIYLTLVYMILDPKA